MVAPQIRSEYVPSIPGVFLWHILQVEENTFEIGHKKKESEIYIKNKIQINVDLLYPRRF